MNQSQSKIQQDKDLQMALQSAERGDALEFVKGVISLQSNLKDHFVKQYYPIDANDVEDLIAEAVEVLFDNIKNGKKVFKVAPFLFKVTKYKLLTFKKKQITKNGLPRFLRSDINNDESFGSHILRDDTDILKGVEEKDSLKKLLRLVRSLISEFKHQTAQDVMNYIFDAYEQGFEIDIPAREIAEALGLTEDTVRQSRRRGFNRLQEKILERGLLDPRDQWNLDRLINEAEDQ